MNNKKATNSKSLITSFFCVIITLIFLVKAEITIYAPETEYSLSLSKIDVPPKRSSDFAVAHTELMSICELTPFHYDNYLRHQLKSFKCTSSHNHEHTSILQKHNILHQSSDEDPVLWLNLRFIKISVFHECLNLVV